MGVGKEERAEVALEDEQCVPDDVGEMEKVEKAVMKTPGEREDLAVAEDRVEGLTERDGEDEAVLVEERHSDAIIEKEAHAVLVELGHAVALVEKEMERGAVAEEEPLPCLVRELEEETLPEGETLGDGEALGEPEDHTTVGVGEGAADTVEDGEGE